MESEYERISLEFAKKDKLFYFVANVVVFRESDGKCLILKRSETEKVHPGRWCVPGGKLEWNQLDAGSPTRVNGDVLDFEDAVEKLLSREAEEEAGIRIGTDLRYLNSAAFIRPDGIPVILVKFASRYEEGEVRIENGAFTDAAWVDGEEIKAYECIDGIIEEVGRTIRLYRE